MVDVAPGTTRDLPAAEWRALGTGIRLVVLDGDLEAARRAVVGVLDDVDRTIVAAALRAVMAMGGFTGSDNAPTLEQLPALVAADELRFVAVGDDGGRPDAGSSSISAWVTSACTAVSVDGSSSTVYDCAGAVTG